MMRVNLRQIVVLGLGLTYFLSGCSGVKVTSDHDPNVNVSAYKTYDYLQNPRAPAADGKSVTTILDTRIKDALDSTLASKGYRRATEGKPDFLVSYGAKSSEHFAAAPAPAGYYSYGAWGGPGGVESYEEGTLIVDLVDSKTNKAFWHGTATQVIDSPEVSTKDIKEDVSKMFAKYPN